MDYNEEKTDREPEQEPKLMDPDVYTPRPKWQRILALTMCAILVIGIILYYFWIMYRY